MTKDVLALTPKMPDQASLLAALHAGGPDLGLTATDDGAVIQLRTAAGRPLVSVEAPLLVHVPGEAERLLGAGTTAPGLPYWWTEARASTATPEAEPLAESVCGRLTLLLGGTTWPPAAAAHTARVTVPDEPPATQDFPTVDALTDSTAVVLSDRPLLPLTAWLSDTLRATAQSNRALHLVTPPHVRLTLPLRTALGGAPNRWVVQDPQGGYYDGLAGVRLAWRSGTFAPIDSTLAEAFTVGAAPTEHRQLTVSFRTVHAPDERLVLGRALEAAWRHLTGSPPVGWGTAEPVNLPWSPQQLTDLARERIPAPTQIVAVGGPAIATQRVSRTTAGVAEEISLTLGYERPQDLPLAALESLAATLVTEHGLTTMLTTVRAARADLTLLPRVEGPPLPVSFTLGPRDVRKIGLPRAGRPPIAAQPRRLGSPASPALHYPLGDGTDPKAWSALQTLGAYLKTAGGGPPSRP
ncbi:DUF6177 family protein [Streptomyces griseoruber]|uniref:Uncharacterized protein n=1 Tax=Streptomyces griseoruber TaxID=1943 RepID=A0A101SY80_9ACTN|nr:DUF6177 family protein [Streptomyces griseoruber]KUN82362.1 hypothetical protein AQJ64_20005 [Streptomyces griseoruber]